MLATAGQGVLERGTDPYQSAALLVNLRNAIVHYRFETTTVDEEHRLQRQLQGRFPDNPMTAAGNAWWPDKCLGSGCAVWTCRVAERLVEEVVVTRLGLDPSYRRALKSSSFPRR